MKTISKVKLSLKPHVKMNCLDCYAKWKANADCYNEGAIIQCPWCNSKQIKRDSETKTEWFINDAYALGEIESDNL